MKNTATLPAVLLFASALNPLLPFHAFAQGPSLPPYRTPTIAIDARVADLLQRMTLEEKAAQLDMYWGREMSEAGAFSRSKADSAIGTRGIGAVHDLYPATAELSNAIQRYARTQTRLGIPVLFIEEGLHGYQGRGSTTFPQAIGLASTWDTALVRGAGAVIGEEARAHGVHMILGPVLDLAREPRWGRTEETYGEDTFLASQIGLAMVRGMQGGDLRSDHAVIAEPKHFAVHGIPESGSNTAPVSLGEREMRSSYLPVFETAFRQGGALGVMAAYHELDGIPCVSNRWLLTNILRKEWGFRGFVLSDLGAVSMQVNTHRTASTPKDAIVQALRAGLDMQFYDFEHDVFQTAVVEAAREGLLPATDLDRAVGDVLRVKFMLGLFDVPDTDTTLAQQRVHSAKNTALARKASDESLCLLNNAESLLPLSKQIPSIAVIGPLANASALGDYSPSGAAGVTILQALRDKYGATTKITYEPGAFPNSLLTIVDPKYVRTKDGVPGGLTGEYFNNVDLIGTPSFKRTDSTLALYWGVDSPAPGIRCDSFSVRWTGSIVPPASGTYELAIISDDKGRLFWNDSLLIDNWTDFQLNVTKTQTVAMTVGRPYPIRMEFADLSDYAGIRLSWRLVREDASAADSPIARAATAAKHSAVAVVVVGETDEMVGEGKDRSDLTLGEQQEDLVEAVYNTGTPTVVVLLNGRPLSIDWCARHVPAILEAWFPGEAGGTAIVDALFGDVNPSGRLPISFPKTVGQLPDYYNHKPSAKRAFVDTDGRNLFAFGHGLGYSRFEYSHLTVTPARNASGDSIIVTVDVRNAGTHDGVEVVQCYLTRPVSSVTTPVLTLCAFARVPLKAGECQTATMVIRRDQLAVWNREMQHVVEPGEYQIQVGHASNDLRVAGTFTLTRE